MPRDLARREPPPTPAELAAPPDRSDVLAAFLEGRNPRTLRGYTHDLEDFARFRRAGSAALAVERFLALPAGQANYVARSFVTHLKARKLSANTIARRIAALRSMVRLARKIGVVAWTL